MTEINELAAALAQAQGKFKPVSKTGKNPHLRNEYATLDDIIGAIRGPLSEHGLSFVQLLSSNGDGVTNLKTILLHESGQQLESSVTVAADPDHRGINDLQALGAAITYMKRYSLSAMLGIAADADTDGEGADNVKRPERRPTAQRPQGAPAPTNGDNKPKTARPLSAEAIRAVCREKAKWADGPAGKHSVRNENLAKADKQVGPVANLLAAATPNLDSAMQNRARHDVLNYLFGVTSTTDLTKPEAGAIIDWLKVKDDKSWDPNEYAQAEVAAILGQVARDEGQVEMALDAEPPQADEDAPF